MRPPAATLEQLRTSRLLPAHARPSVGTGERRSRRKGAGMEFIDFRPYRAGDDIRHLDPHLYARTGEHVLREYAVSQQLPVTIVVDNSGSMQGDKLAQAQLLAQLFGFATLAGGDRVQFAVADRLGLRMSPRWHGVARAEPMFDWVGKLEAVRDGAFVPLLQRLRRELSAHGLVIVIGDFWDDGLETVLDEYSVAGQDLIAVQVLAPTEIDPAGMDTGEFVMDDIESGEEIGLTLDAGALARYRQLFASRQEALRSLLHGRHWPIVTLSSAEDAGSRFIRIFRGEGLIA